MEELYLKEVLLMLCNKKLEILLIILIFLVVGIIYSYFYISSSILFKIIL